MLELKEFIFQSLSQIIDGVIQAQAYAKDKNAYINPVGLVRVEANHYLMTNYEAARQQEPIAEFIEFDMAVTASESRDAKAGVGVFAAAVGLGAQTRIEDANKELSRIKFSVPVIFPQQQQ